MVDGNAYGEEIPIKYYVHFVSICISQLRVIQVCTSIFFNDYCSIRIMLGFRNTLLENFFSLCFQMIAERPVYILGKYIFHYGRNEDFLLNNDFREIGVDDRDLQQTSKATRTRTLQIKRSNQWKSNFVRAFESVYIS